MIIISISVFAEETIVKDGRVFTEENKMTIPLKSVRTNKNGKSVIAEYSGILSAREGNWRYFDSVNLKYINESKESVTCEYEVSDGVRSQKKLVTFDPGEHILSLEIPGLKSTENRLLSLDSIENFGFRNADNKKNIVLKVLECYLERKPNSSIKPRLVSDGFISFDLISRRRELKGQAPTMSEASGLLIGKESNWKAFDFMRVKYHNAGKEKLICRFFICDDLGHGNTNELFNKYVEFQPGENIIDIDVQGLASRTGRPLNLENIRSFSFGSSNNKDNIDLKIQECYLEKKQKFEINPRLISNMLVLLFFKTNKFTVVDRINMDEILKEQKFQLSGCTKTDCAVEVGKILNVKYMVMGSIKKFEKKYTVNIRVVDIESSEIILADMDKCNSESEIVATLKTVVENISINKVFSENMKQNTIAILDLETKKE